MRRTFVGADKPNRFDWAGPTVVQRKFDFTRLAESALLDDFEVVGRVQPVAASASSTLTSSSTHYVTAADAAERGYHTAPTHGRNVAYMEMITKHVYV